MSKRQIKFIFSGLILLFSVLAIILSDNPSKESTSFREEESSSYIGPEEFKSRESEDVYEEEILGQYEISSEDLELSPPPKELDEQYVVKNANQTNNEGYKVLKIIDGDTIDIETPEKAERLRLIGIDTPETVDPRKDVQCFGIEASNKAKELLGGKLVSLESDETQGDRDKYKRLLRYVFLPDGTNFNLYMISEGYAFEYTYANPYKYQFDFRQAQKLAMENEKGLWSPSTCSGNK